MARAGFILIAVLALAPAKSSRAGPVEGLVPALLVVAGGLGGATTSVAGIVYAMDNRAFDDGWVVGSLFSSAICASTSTALFLDAIGGSGGGGAEFIGVLFFAGIAA